MKSSLRDAMLMLSLAGVAAIDGAVGKRSKEREARKPDPDKTTKNQAKAARRAARARKGGH